MKELFGIVGELVGEIVDAIKDGVSDEEILERISKPGGVGEKLIAAARARRSKLDDFIANG